MNIRTINPPVPPQQRGKFGDSYTKSNQTILVIHAPWKQMAFDVVEASRLSLIDVMRRFKAHSKENK